MTALEDALEEQARAWDERPLLRRIYGEWYQALLDRLSPVDGCSLELGSGIGKLRDLAGNRIVLTDVEKTRWVDDQVDAIGLPYRDGSVANILMLDVFHHLADPAAFLDEATRALAPGGRVLMIEPYCSRVSTLLYRRFHHERTELDADPLRHDPSTASSPMDSNQAVPTLVFYRRREEVLRRWSALALVEERRFSFVTYPLSGGFSRQPLVPVSLFRALQLIERLLSPLAPLLAFRCLVVLERRREPPGQTR